MGNLVFQATLGGQVNLVGPNTASTFNLNVPATSSTLATLTGTETFTNKTLTSPTLTTPVLGTPSSGTLTNCTGLPNAGLVNSSVTVGSTSIALGATATTLAGLTSVGSNLLTSAASTALTLQSAGTTAVTIDTSQNVGIGTTSPSLTGATKALTINAPASGNYSAIELASAGAATANFIANSSNVYIGSYTNIPFVFQTNNTERMRIDTSGNLLVGTTSQVAQGKVSVVYSNTVGQGLCFNENSASGLTRDAVRFQTSGTQVGSISVSTTATAYVTSSDYRLKNSVAPMTDALAKVALLKPCTYKWNSNGSDGEGFIAHELAEVCPQAVAGEKDAVDADGNPVYQGIDTSFLVATLTAAIQEQQATINALTARVVALEAK